MNEVAFLEELSKIAYDASTRDIEQFGPPGQWSGAVAGVLGDEKRRGIQKFWRSLTSEQKKAARTAFSKRMDKAVPFRHPTSVRGVKTRLSRRGVQWNTGEFREWCASTFNEPHLDKMDNETLLRVRRAALARWGKKKRKKGQLSPERRRKLSMKKPAGYAKWSHARRRAWRKARDFTDTITTTDRAEWNTYLRRSGIHSGGSLRKDHVGFYVATHRVRSPSYPSPSAIPKGRIRFINSTS